MVQWIKMGENGWALTTELCLEGKSAGWGVFSHSTRPVGSSVPHLAPASHPYCSKHPGKVLIPQIGLPTLPAAEYLFSAAHNGLPEFQKPALHRIDYSHWVSGT